MSEQVRVLPMAQLLRLAKEKDAREREEQEHKRQPEQSATAASAPDATASSTGNQPGADHSKSVTPNVVTVPRNTTVPKSTTVPKKDDQLYQFTTVVESGTVPIAGIVTDQFTQVPNGILDRVLPRLKPVEQVVVMRLYRLSRGFNSETCKVGFNTLAKSCNISKSTAQVTIARLINLGVIEVVGVEQGGSNKQDRGTIYKINLPGAAIPRKSTVPKSTTVSESTTNKYIHIKETHTNTGAAAPVGVGGSRFSLQQCQRYANHLREAGQGITNPGGYATTIHRSGEADEQIEAYLNPTPQASLPRADTSRCPDCRGTGWWYPHGTEKGAARCKHERLPAERW